MADRTPVFKGIYDIGTRVDQHIDEPCGSKRHNSEEKRKRRARKRARDRAKKPSYEKTMSIVRGIVTTLRRARSDEALTVEGIAKIHELDKGHVHRSLTVLRAEGLMNPPKNTPHPGTWRGGGYDDWSAWVPTRWTVRLPVDPEAP